METLRNYLNSMPVAKQAEYAVACGTTIGYLRKVLYSGQKIRGEVCRLLYENSGRKVSRSELRPDIWPPKRAPVPLVKFKTEKRKRIKADGCL